MAPKKKILPTYQLGKPEIITEIIKRNTKKLNEIASYKKLRWSK